MVVPGICGGENERKEERGRGGRDVSETRRDETRRERAVKRARRTSKQPVPQVGMTLIDERFEIEAADAESDEVRAVGEDFWSRSSDDGTRSQRTRLSFPSLSIDVRELRAESEIRTLGSRKDIGRELVDSEKVELRSNVSKDRDDEMGRIGVVVEVVFLVHEMKLFSSKWEQEKKQEAFVSSSLTEGDKRAMRERRESC